MSPTAPTTFLMRVPLYPRDDHDLSCWACGREGAEFELRIHHPGDLIEQVGIHHACIRSVGVLMVEHPGRASEVPS